MHMSQTNIAILLSGRGSNAKKLMEIAQSDDFPGKIVVVISNNPDVAGLSIAKKFNIPTYTIDHRLYHGDRDGHEQEIVSILQKYNVQIICLAGYMRLLKHVLLEHYPRRILNIHPSLLPAFPGLNTHEHALERGVKIHGCTVHIVTPGMDEGPILDQRSVRVSGNDTPSSLADKVLAQEHELYPAALKNYLLQLNS